MIQLNACFKDLTGVCNYNNHKKLCVGILLASVGVGVVRVWWNRRRVSKTRKDYPRDTVILHQPGRGPYAPSAVPFATKLETYLRMAKIPYQNEFNTVMSSKNKFPWITYNGEDVDDSAFIIQFLNQRCDLDLSAWLTPEQRGVAVAFQRLAEDNLYWVLIVFRFIYEMDADFLGQLLPLGPLSIKLLMAPSLRKQAWAQGMGRHSSEEVRQIAREDLAALSKYMGIQNQNQNQNQNKNQNQNQNQN